MKPSLTYVLITYNDTEWLVEILNAFLGMQKNESIDVSILIMDDCSEINVKYDLKEINFNENNIRIIRNERNMGINATINMAVENCSTTYIYIGSTHDPILPSFFSESVKALEKYPHASFSFMDPGEYRKSIRKYKNYPLLLASSTSFLSPTDIVNLRRRRPFHFSSNTIVYRTSKLKEVGYVDKLEVYADWFTPNFLAMKYGCVYIPQVLSYVLLQSKSYSKNFSKRKLPLLIQRFFLQIKEQDRKVYDRLKESKFILSFPCYSVLKCFHKNPIKELLSISIIAKFFILSFWRQINKLIPIFIRRRLFLQWDKLNGDKKWI